MPSAIEGHQHGRVPRELRAKQLLDVAEVEFSRLGYQATSIDAIAEAAGVTRPMIYNLFKSKDGIYTACLKRARGALEARILEAFSGKAGVKTKLHRGFEAYFSFLEDYPSAWALLYGGGNAVSGPAAQEILSLRFNTVQVIAALLAKELGKPVNDELIVLAHTISGGAEQVAKLWRERPELNSGKLVKQLTQTFSSNLSSL